MEGADREDAGSLHDRCGPLGCAALRAENARSALPVDAPDPRRAQAERGRARRASERGEALPPRVGAPPGSQGARVMPFRTALRDLLGIDYPIVQSGMGPIAGPELGA